MVGLSFTLFNWSLSYLSFMSCCNATPPEGPGRARLAAATDDWSDGTYVSKDMTISQWSVRTNIKAKRTKLKEQTK